MSLIDTFILGGVAILTFISLIWLLSLYLKNAAIMDIFWGLGLLLTSQVYAYFLPNQTVYANILLGVVILWGIRLSLYIAVRGWGEVEDARYLAWRNENGQRWWWYSFFKVFLLQGVIMWIVSLVLLMALAGPQTAMFVYLGILLFAIGFIFETVADCQMWRFKRNPANKGKVLDTGFWKYTRHPNYFGEALVWWGFGLFALAGGYWWALISPLLMHFLLVKVSGVAMLDRLLSETKPKYHEYIRSTSAFIPWSKKGSK